MTLLYAEHCGRTHEEFQQAKDPDRFMTAEEALEWALSTAFYRLGKTRITYKLSRKSGLSNAGSVRIPSHVEISLFGTDNRKRPLMNQSAYKFDSSRAAEYENQSRVALAGYEACHELAACMLAAALGTGGTRRILIIGVGGTAQEVIAVSRLEPTWTFVGVDPSEPMLTLAVEHLKAQGLDDRIELHPGTLDTLAGSGAFDAAMMLGVLHHLPGYAAKAGILKAIADRIAPGAPLILAGNRYAYASKPLLLAAWRERWRMHGATSDEVEAKLGKILQGADPPHSQEAVFELLDGAGFERAEGFFSSLFWGAWIAWRKRG